MANEILLTTESRKYKTLVTDIGKEKITNAVLSGEKVKITEAAVGDGGGTYYVPTADMTALKREMWRGEIATATVNPQSRNMIDIKIFLDGTVGGFTIREIGIFDEDGDMIAICNTPDTEKAVLVDGIAATLTVLMHVVFTDVDVLEFHVDPSVDTVSSEDLQNAIQAHNEDPNAHESAIAAQVESRITGFVIFSALPPVKGPALWFCTDRNWRPERARVATALLGNPAQADSYPVQSEVNDTVYPVLNATVSQEGGNIVATIHES